MKYLLLLLQQLYADYPLHIHGGEITKSSIDEVFRHSITKMSHLHFTASWIQKSNTNGEKPENVFTVGGLR